MDSIAASRLAAHRHALAVAAGAPRSARWILPSAAVSACGAAVALPLLRAAGLALAAVTVLLVAVHRQDRRNAWRYAPEPVTPGRFLPPLRPEKAASTSATMTATAAPAVEPRVKAVHSPTQPVRVAALPRPRTPVERSSGVGQCAAVADPDARRHV